MAHIAKEKREDVKPGNYKSVYDPGNGENTHRVSNHTLQDMEAQGVYDTVPPTRAQLEEAGDDYAEYVRKVQKNHSPVKTGKIIALLALALVIIFGGFVFFMGGSLISLLANGLPGTGASIAVPVEVKGSEMTDDERQMLASSGYNPEDFTNTLKNFLGVYLTYSPGSLSNGQWHDNVGKYVDSAAVDSNTENDLNSRWANADWISNMAGHPSAISNLESIDDVEWYMADDGEGKQVPFCFVRATLTRPAIDYYALNSPACSVCRFQDDYNVYFTADGDVCRIRRIAHAILESDLESELTAQDSEKMQKERDAKKDAIDYEAIARRKKAEADAKKKAAAAEAKAKAKEKAEAEAEAAEEEAEEENQRKEAERNKKKEKAASNSDSEESSDSGGNSGSKSGGESGNNSGGNSSGNSSASSDSEPEAKPAKNESSSSNAESGKAKDD
jgi:uncharacterized membrane protein YgcG